MVLISCRCQKNFWYGSWGFTPMVLHSSSVNDR